LKKKYLETLPLSLVDFVTPKAGNTSTFVNSATYSVHNSKLEKGSKREEKDLPNESAGKNKK